MNRSLCVILILALSACAPSEPEETPAPAAEATPPADPSIKWTVTEGIEGPESAYVDTASNAIYVSQVTGMPTEKDGTGRIAKLDMNGAMVNANWVTGLNAPKGIRVHEGTLWTADIDEVVGIDVAMGTITSRVKIEGAQFLNDVAVGPDGTVYVSDMMGTAIHAIKDGKSSVFAQGEDLEYPNGLLVENGKLIVAAWGKPGADFSTEVPGRIFSLDLATKQKTLITQEPSGNFDGIESDGAGGYIATDWFAGKVVHIMSNGTVHPLKQLMQGTADHAYMPADKTLVLPHMNENKVVAYNLGQ